MDGTVILTDGEIVETKTKAVQHQRGGTVATIHVAEGQQVRSGDLLVSFNTTDLDQQIASLETRLAAAVTDAERLRALEAHLASAAALRGEALVKVKTAYDLLEAVVDELLPTHASDPAVEPLAHRLALVRSVRKPNTG